jgi:hypothetical protein
MSEYIERMCLEHKELTERLGNLNVFILGSLEFKTLSDKEQHRMIKQAGFMTAYAQILAERIAES